MADCERCGARLEPGARACPSCNALVHRAEVARLIADATALETAGKFRDSRALLIRAFDLLPPNTRQASWIAAEAARLEAVPDRQHPSSPSSAPGWAQRLGPLAPLAVAIFKGKGLLALFNMKSLTSLGAFMGFYWSTFGAQFGIGFAILILIHELGHYVDITRRGLPADMPVFLPGLGAYVRWQAMGVSLETRAAVSLAGPLAGALAALLCAGLWWATGAALWAALARAGAWLNILNLIPVWALDGGQAATAMGRSERAILLWTSLALWLIFGEAVFALVAGGAVWRYFTRDTPPAPSPATTAYFVGLLVALGIIMRAMPGEGFGL